MKLRKMFKRLKELKKYRKDYVIKPKVIFEIDDSHYFFYLIPTIGFMPWIYRWPGTSVLEIMWLNMHICFGIWEAKKDDRQSDGS